MKIKKKKYKYKRKYIYYKDDLFIYRKVIVIRYKYNTKRRKYFYSKKYDYKQIKEAEKWVKIDDKFLEKNKNKEIKADSTFVIAKIKDKRGHIITYTKSIPIKLKSNKTINNIVKQDFINQYAGIPEYIECEYFYFNSKKIKQQNKYYKELKKLQQELKFLKKMKNKIGDDIYKKQIRNYEIKIEKIKNKLKNY